MKRINDNYGRDLQKALKKAMHTDRVYLTDCNNRRVEATTENVRNLSIAAPYLEIPAEASVLGIKGNFMLSIKKQGQMVWLYAFENGYEYVEDVALAKYLAA